jgi:stage II sporulation protein D
MNLALLPVLLITTLSTIFSSGISSRATSLPVSQTDSIEVLLFDDLNVQELKIRAKDGILTLIANNKDFQIDSTAWVTIQKTRNGYRFKQNGNIVYAHELSVVAHGNSLTNLISEATGYRYYRGTLLFQNLTNEALTPVNKISLEDYVASVTGSEMNFDHLEALKTQSVIARTYALWNMASPVHPRYHLTDHTMSQVYLGELIQKPIYRTAAEATSGTFITWSNKLILATYSSTCGGATSSNQWVWSGKALPYLQTVDDNDACSASHHFNWNYTLSTAEFNYFLKRNFKSSVQQFDINKSVNGRVVELKTGNKIISANKFRLAFIKQYGPRSLKSTLFTVEKSKESVIFIGHGMGHGVGLCQWGALGLAKSGWTHDTILRFYYQGITLSNLSTWAEQEIPLARN